MGLWEDAQQHKLPEDRTSELSARQRADISEFVTAMARLGVPTSHHEVCSCRSDRDGTYFSRIKNATLEGWSVGSVEMQGGAGGVHITEWAALVVSRGGEIFDCSRQPRGDGGFFRPRTFAPKAETLPYVGWAPEHLSGLLRDALSRAMRGDPLTSRHYRR